MGRAYPFLFSFLQAVGRLAAMGSCTLEGLDSYFSAAEAAVRTEVPFTGAQYWDSAVVKGKQGLQTDSRAE
jgi:hypothetical protein